MHVMSLVSFIGLVHEARQQRDAVREAHDGTLPNLIPSEQITARMTVDTSSVPVATVVQPAPGGAPLAPTQAAVRMLEEPVSVDMNSTRPVPTMARTGDMVGNTQDAGADMLQPHACPPSSAAGAVAESVQRGDGVAASAPDMGMGLAAEESGIKHAQHAWRASMEDSAESAAKEQSKWGAVLHSLWDSVSEDPRTGFKCASANAPLATAV